MAINAEFEINNTTILMPDGNRYGPGREADLRKALRNHHQGEKLFKQFVDRGALLIKGQSPEPNPASPVVKSTESGKEPESETQEPDQEKAQTPHSEQEQKEAAETGESFDIDKQTDYPDETPDQSWTKKELHNFMDSKGIDYASNDNKAELVAKIEHFQET